MTSDVTVPVHGVSICAVKPAPGSDGHLLAALGVAVTLPDEALTARAVGRGPLRLVVTDAQATTDGLALDVTVADEDDPAMTAMTLRLPTAAAGLLTVLDLGPVTFKAVLLHQPGPFVALAPVIDWAEAAAVVTVDLPVMHHALSGVLHPSLTVPLAADVGPEPIWSEEADTFRDGLWAACSRLAEGQPVGEVAMTTLIGHVQSHMDGGSDGAEFTPMAAALGAALRRSGLEDSVDDLDLPEGVEVADHIDQQGRRLAEHAAFLAAQSGGTTRPGRMLALWMSPDGQDPSWAFRPLATDMLAHDATLALSLLGSNQPTGDLDDRAVRIFVHVAGVALAEADMDPEDLLNALNTSEIRHLDHEMVLAFARTILLAREDDEDDLCIGCVAVDFVREHCATINDVVTLTAHVLMYMADVQPAMVGLAVGEADWVQHRTVWIDEMLDRAV